MEEEEEEEEEEKEEEEEEEDEEEEEEEEEKKFILEIDEKIFLEIVHIIQVKYLIFHVLRI